MSTLRKNSKAPAKRASPVSYAKTAPLTNAEKDQLLREIQSGRQLRSTQKSQTVLRSPQPRNTAPPREYRTAPYLPLYKNPAHKAMTQLNKMPECYRNFVKLRSNPFQPVNGDWCNLGATEANVVANRSIMRFETQAGPDGTFWVVMNPYCIANDQVSVLWSNGQNTGFSIDTTQGGTAGLAPKTPYPRSVLNRQETGNRIPVQARIVAAGICVQPSGNLLNTQGRVGAYRAPQGRLQAGTPLEFADISADINQPTSNLRIDSCYSVVWTPHTKEQSEFLADEPMNTTPMPYEADIINSFTPVWSGTIDRPSAGYQIALWGRGFTPNYPIHVEVAQWYETGDQVILPSMAKQTTSDTRFASVVNRQVTEASKQHVETPPSKGFFDTVLDGLGKIGDKVGEALGKFVGAAAGEFVAAF